MNGSWIVVYIGNGKDRQGLKIKAFNQILSVTLLTEAGRIFLDPLPGGAG